MGFFKRILGGQSGQPDFSAAHELRAIWDSYSEQWPDNCERYAWWKPTSVLPAPKWAIKRAMKLCYADWPEPIDWGIFSAFFMEFADLALHLPQEKYDAIDTFRKRRIRSFGKVDEHDPLMFFRLSSPLAPAWTKEHGNQEIIKIRDGLRRSAAWEPIDVDDYELDTVRGILLESAVEFATLVEEWRFYILSIGRDKYVENS